MAEQINERIGTGDIPTLLGGDFNARHDSNVICEVMKNWQRICDDTFTYPADQPTIYDKVSCYHVPYGLQE